MTKDGTMVKTADKPPAHGIAKKQRKKDPKKVRAGKSAKAALAVHRKNWDGPSTRKVYLRGRLLEFYGHPDTPLPENRSEMARAVNVTKKTLYMTFCAAELADIDMAILDRRRARYGAISVHVDNALIRKALSGDVKAIKLFYQRFEGWSEKTIHAFEFNDEQLRAMAIDRGYDPNEYIEAYRTVRGQISEQ